MKHLMLDLETMGVNPDAAITAIGAVMFDLETGELGDTFYRVIDLATAVDRGGVMDASTVLWWMQQSDEARRIYTTQGGDYLLALEDFAGFCYHRQPTDVWGNGAMFDNAILARAYQRAKMPQPWSFRADRCFRTFKALFPCDPPPREGVYHNALDDAIFQVKHLRAMIEAHGVPV